MPEPASTTKRPDPEEILQAVHDAEASRLADRLSSITYCTDETAAGLLEDKVRAHRTINAEDFPGLPEGTVFRCANGNVVLVRAPGRSDILGNGKAVAFPATVLVEAGDDL